MIVEKFETNEFTTDSNPFLKGIEVKHSPQLKIVSDVRKSEHEDFGMKYYVDVEVTGSASKTDLHEYEWHYFDGAEWTTSNFTKEQIADRFQRKTFTYTPNKTSFNSMVNLLGSDTKKLVGKTIVCRVEKRMVVPKEARDQGLEGMPMDTIMVEGAN